MAQEQAYTQGSGSVFFQPDGPNTPLEWLGCHDVGDIEEPLGEVELGFCRTADGAGYAVISEGKSPPEVVSTSISGLSQRVLSSLYNARCPGALYVMRRCKGRLDRLTSYERVSILQRARVTSITEGEPVHHIDDGPPVMDEFEIQAWPPVIRVVEVAAGRKATAETLALNSIATNTDKFCAGGCVGVSVDPGDYLVIGADGGAGTANYLLSTDGGLTWAAAAADPFGVGLHISGVARINISKTITRLLAVKEAVGGAQGQTAFSDDNGATWTVVNIGGAAAGHGPTYGPGTFVMDADLMIIAGEAGYIYKSTDGGASWSVVDAAGVTAGAYTAVDFADDYNGVAVAAAGIVAVTTDGGATWKAATPITGVPALRSVAMVSPYVIWVGTDTGLLFYSNDGGVTWNPRVGWTGTGVGQVRAIDFVNDFVGFMVSNTAAPVGTVLRTIDGGLTWAVVTTPANSGLNFVKAINENLAFVVGEANAATGVILKVQA